MAKTTESTEKLGQALRAYYEAVEQVNVLDSKIDEKDARIEELEEELRQERAEGYEAVRLETEAHYECDTKLAAANARIEKLEEASSLCIPTLSTSPCG
jgi:exonuclease VII small subunit